jgi:hypothetical protein
MKKGQKRKVIEVEEAPPSDSVVPKKAKREPVVIKDLVVPIPRFFEGENDLHLLPSGLKAKYRKDLLDGVVTINGTASSTSKLEKMDITAIPYYAWSNREIGKMKVWMPFSEND